MQVIYKIGLLFTTFAAIFITAVIIINDPAGCAKYDDCRLILRNAGGTDQNIAIDGANNTCAISFRDRGIARECRYINADECELSARMCLRGANGCPAAACVNPISLLLLFIALVPMYAMIAIAVDYCNAANDENDNHTKDPDSWP